MAGASRPPWMSFAAAFATGHSRRRLGDVFNLSGSELIFLVLIALVVLGPDKLPEAMRKAGKAYNDFKKMTSGFQDEMRSALDEPMREMRETADLVKKSAMFDPSPVAAATVETPATPIEADTSSSSIEQSAATTPDPTVVDSVAEENADLITEEAPPA